MYGLSYEVDKYFIEEFLKEGSLECSWRIFWLVLIALVGRIIYLHYKKRKIKSSVCVLIVFLIFVPGLYKVMFDSPGGSYTKFKLVSNEKTEDINMSEVKKKIKYIEDKDGFNDIKEEGDIIFYGYEEDSKRYLFITKSNQSGDIKTNVYNGSFKNTLFNTIFSTFDSLKKVKDSSNNIVYIQEGIEITDLRNN
ncbi:MAG: hypothetical protein ACRCWM_04945 [Sarcina sp.]